MSKKQRKCPLCGSKDIYVTNYGYLRCRICGLLYEEQLK